jgi:hypothetical protein
MLSAGSRQHRVQDAGVATQAFFTYYTTLPMGLASFFFHKSGLYLHEGKFF